MAVVCLFGACGSISAAEVRFDFGSSSGKQPGHWNHVTDPHALGEVVRNAIDDRGKPTAVRLSLPDAWFGVNRNGTRASRLPSEVTRDSFVVGRGNLREARIRIEGLKAGSRYTLTLFASRMGGSDIRVGTYRIGTDAHTLDAQDNVEREAVFPDVLPDAGGGITLEVSARNPGFAYLGALRISGRFPSAREKREPRPALEDPPIVSARAWAVADGGTGSVLWSDRSPVRLPIASTTKLMTAWVVAREARRHPGVLGEWVLVSEAADKTPGSTAGIREGERVQVRELLYGLLLPSGNDAATALAEHFNARLPAPGRESVAGTVEPAIARFVAAMNREALRLGMRDTHYVNPHGLDAAGHFSSAEDLVRLGHAVIHSRVLAPYVKTVRHQGTLQTPEGEPRKAAWKNTNQLLPLGGFNGVKTGTTSCAGACLVSSGIRNGRHLIVVVLGASSRDGRYVDSRNLFEWAWRQ